MAKSKLKKFLRIFSASKSGKTSKFPVLATLLLIFGIVWLVNDIGFADIKLPWLPVILIVVAIAMFANRYR